MQMFKNNVLVFKPMGPKLLKSKIFIFSWTFFQNILASSQVQPNGKYYYTVCQRMKPSQKCCDQKVTGNMTVLKIVL